MSESQVKSNPTNLGAKTPSGNQSTSKVNPAPQTSVPQVFVVKPTAPTASKIIPAPAGLQTTSVSNTTRPATELPKKPADSTSVKPTTQVAQPQNPTVQFHSASIDPAAKKADYFAEQNQKAAAEKTKHKKITKKVLLIGTPILILVIIAVVLAIIFLSKQTVAPPTEGESVNFSTGNTADNLNELNTLVSNAYNPTFDSDSETGPIDVSGDLSAVEKVFTDTLANPDNQSHLNVINYAQVNFYGSYGYYDKVLEIFPNVDASTLSTEERMQFYNYVYLAYYFASNETEAQNYYKLAQDAAAELGEFGG